MSPADPGADFDAIVESYYRAWFRFHPERAVDAGVDGYAQLLAPCGDDDLGALLALNENLLADLEDLDYAALDPDRQVDFDVLYGAAHIEAHELHEFDWRFHDPVRFLPVDALHQLFLRPVRHFAEALKARLAAIPEHLRAARGYLSQAPELIPVLWLETAVGSARAGADYVRALQHHPKVHQALANPESLHGLLEQAAGALVEYANYLEGELAGKAEGDFACGPSQFNRLLRYRHFLEVDADALHAFGERLVAQTRRELLDCCRELTGGEDVHGLLARIRAEHPPAEGLLEAYRESVQAARAFLVESDLVTLPARETLKVVETPVFLRNQIPFAAYVEPAPNDPEQCGHYYVTPVADPARLAEHSAVGIAHTGVHEAWPGHHLQFVTAHARAASRSLPRLLNPSATLYEGWALYSEQLMQERGFLVRPESRFLLLRDRLWRALRIVLDVELHTRGLGLAEAAERIVEELGFSYSQAMGELTWYSRSPTVPMGYATGWAMIGAVRERLQAERPGLVLRDFHDRLLAAGSVALPRVLRRQFDADLCKSVHNMLF